MCASHIAHRGGRPEVVGRAGVGVRRRDGELARRGLEIRQVELPDRVLIGHSVRQIVEGPSGVD